MFHSSSRQNTPSFTHRAGDVGDLTVTANGMQRAAGYRGADIRKQRKTLVTSSGYVKRRQTSDEVKGRKTRGTGDGGNALDTACSVNNSGGSTTTFVNEGYVKRSDVSHTDLSSYPSITRCIIASSCACVSPLRCSLSLQAFHS